MPTTSLVQLFKEQLENESRSLAKAYDLTKRGDFLIWWYFLKLRSLMPADIDQIVCDSGNDLGIDAIQIDDADYVHFYQFKNPESADSSLPGGDVDKLLSGLRLILSRRHQPIANEELKGLVEDIYQIVPAGYRLHLVTSGRGIAQESVEKLNAFVQELGGPSEDFFVWTLEDIEFLQDAFYQKRLPRSRQVGISTSGFEDPDENFVELVNSVPDPALQGNDNHRSILRQNTTEQSEANYERYS